MFLRLAEKCKLLLRENIFFYVWNFFFFKCGTWFFFLLSWQQWSLSNGSFFCWSLTLLINFGQISYGEIGRSLKSCINAHITGKKNASDVSCSVSPLLTDGREEWWCESGVVLGVCFKQRPKENVTVDTNTFGTLHPPAFFYITACTLLCGKANILLVISQLFYVQERAWLVTKITRWEDTMITVASLQELFLVSLVAGVGAEALGIYHCFWL